ncbi:MAG: acetate--CoA ligase [Methanomassiliicoccales archaeon]|nr:acetate--CoA ligase [Methanomassiliicoccales archaeon]
MEEIIAREGLGNLKDYQTAYREFNWSSMDKDFDWSRGGSYNVAAEAVDRHGRGELKNKVALHSFKASGEVRSLTFKELSRLSSEFAGGLLKLGVSKGDRVFVYLDRTSELFIALIGITKMGGIAGPLFSALGPEAVRDRVADGGPAAIVTSPYLYHRTQSVLAGLPHPPKFIILGDNSGLGGTISFEDVLKEGDQSFEAVDMDPSDPYIIHYTSGSTGKPKGVLLPHRAMLQQLLGVRYVADLGQDDVYWCTADPGWVTGTSVGIFGPWYVGATIISFEGRFDARTWYSIIEKFKVNVWFTAPTALRMLMKAGDAMVKDFDLSSLRHICSAGEPLNPHVVRWGVEVLHRRIHDNWWQTETGAPCIANYPSENIKPGSMGRPVPGIVAAVVDDQGREVPVGKEGFLALRPGWPSMMIGIWGNITRYREYFYVPGWYVTGDQAFKDKDGYIWFLGRADDVIKTSGERLGPFEVESALIEHPSVAESAVVGKPDELRGEIVKAFIVLRPGNEPSEGLKEEITNFVRVRLAYYAYPREIEFVETLPKTRSGKIMRRILKAKEGGSDVGDTSMLDD